MGKNKTHDKYVEELKIKNSNIEVIEKYIDAKTPILHRCIIDNCEWKARPNNILRGDQCPYCSGRRAITSKNDFQTLYPDLMSEWNYDINNKIGLDPSKIKGKSNKKAWWICQNGHEWEATISSRAAGAGCPTCAKEKQTSDPEIKLYFYLKKYFSDAILSYSNKKNKLYELDVYIPSLFIGFEYDGERWHTNPDKDKKKDDICKTLNIQIVRIREPNCPIYQDDNCIFIYLDDLKEETLATAIRNILISLGIKNPKVCFEEDDAAIKNLIIYKQKSNSLLEKFPDIAIDWHPTKNGNLTSSDVSCHSGKKVWWLCHKCGYEWRTRVSTRSNGSGCPKCGHKKTASLTSKQVYCIELDKIFNSMTSVKQQIGIDSTRIHVCCMGIRKSAGKDPITGEKLHWYYVEDQIKKDGSIIKGAISLGLITNEDVQKLLNKNINNNA